MGQGGGRLRGEEIGLVLDQLPLAVVLHDASGTVRYLNPSAEALFGLSQDAIGHDAIALGIAPSDTSTALEIMERLIAAVGRERLRPVPALVVRVLGDKLDHVVRSQRVSNKALREATTWRPRYRSVREGIPAVVNAVGGPTEGARERLAFDRES